MRPPDTAWLPAVTRRLGPVRIVGRAALTGGYVSALVERIDLDVGISVVLKTAGPVEIAAMRALAVVGGVLRPLAVGPDWLVLPFVDGPPLAEGDPVPAAVWTTLARVHDHWRGKRPRGVPVVDTAWWRSMIDHHTLVAVRGARARTGEAAYEEAEFALLAWRDDAVIARALAVLPRTLTHGDAHRGNVLGDTLIDWGNARVAPAGLDLAAMRAQGGEPPDWYPQPSAVEAAWADVQVNVQYLGFAADHLGEARVQEMVSAATAAHARLLRHMDT